MTGMQALLGYTAWTLVLVAIVLTWRVFEVLRGKPINSWGRGFLGFASFLRPIELN